MKNPTLGLPSASRSIMACFAFSLLTFVSLNAQTTTPSEEKQKLVTLETFTVTGSNIKLTTAEADKAALPVELIPEGKFRLTAGESIADALRSQPLVVGNVTSSYNDESQGGNSGVNLRGIGERYTLVLVNGRRAGGEGQPDIGAIPAEAIQSIEILKSGASAIFGSDAVAGVVNIKLKDNFRGIQLTASYGNTTDRDASYKKVGIVFGVAEDKFSLVGGLTWEDRNAIEKYDRSLTASRDYRALGGLDRRTTNRALPNLITLPGNNNRIIDLSRFKPGQLATSASDFIVFDPNLYAYNNNEIGTDPGFERYSGNWNATYKIFDRRLVAFASGYWDRHKQVFKPKESRALVTVPATNPYNPFGTTVTASYFTGGAEGGPVEEQWDIQVLDSSVGLRGEIGNWDYSAAFSHYESVGQEEWRNDLDAVLVQAAANRTDANAFNPFGYWANTPAQLAGLRPTKTAEQSAHTNILDAKVSGDLFNLPAGPVKFAAGAEKRDISFEFVPDYAWQTMSSSIHGTFSPNGGARSVKAYYGELRVPVYTGLDGGFLNAIEVGGAARNEKYSDFGSASVAQFNARAGLMKDSLVLRASWAEGFKAPTVANLFSAVSSSTLSGLYDPVRGAVSTALSITGGNTNLKPESSETLNFGAIYSPEHIKGLTIKADYWKINVTDIIQQPNSQDLLNGTSPGGTVTRDPVTQFPTLDRRLDNGGDIKVAGIDLGASYTWRTASIGRFTFDANATYLLQFEQVDSVTTDFLGEFSNTFGPVPQLRGVIGAQWEKSGWESALFLHYTGGIHEFTAGLTNPDHTSEDYWTADLQVGYKFGEDSTVLGGVLKNTHLYIGVENLWDEALVFYASSTDGWERSLGDFRGRYVYMGIRKKF